MCSLQVTRRIRAALFAGVLMMSGCNGGGGGYNPPPQAPAATPPTITLNAPTATSVNRTVTLTADAVAAAGVTRVEFLIDGTVIANLTAAPFETEWDTSTVADGSHSVTARVTDAANATATSNAATVTVNNHPTIEVALSPEETYPLPNSTASGSGELTFDLTTGSVSGGVTVTGVASTLAHIHRQYAGASGPVIVDFERSAGDSNRWDAVPGAVLTAEQMDDLLAGRLYVNVHSAAYPAGEIRGQIRPESVSVVVTQLSGTEVVPAVATGANAVAATTIDTNAATATVHLNSTATNVTEVHVHVAAAGASNTSVFLTLQQDPTNPQHWSTELQPITSADIAEFDNNGWYLDIHTAANPGGELRGQVRPSPAPPPSPPPAAPTLTELQSAIFTPMCSGCHTGGGAVLPASMDLSNTVATHAALVGVTSVEQASLQRVTPGDPENSYLIHKLEGRPGIVGDRMPLGGPFLSQAMVDDVKEWISAGAANN